MINFINAIIFGVVQGVTEFLPVSSSGHLVILHHFLDLPISNEMTFDVVLHLASLLAVVLFFWKDIAGLFVGVVDSFFGKKSDRSRLAWLIVFAIIPAGFAGLLFDDFIEEVLRSVVVVIVMLVLVGVLFILFERKSKKILCMDSLTLRKAMIIGFAQVLALIPGTSRSGITIIAGLGVGLKREEAIKFSFLMSIPLILGATIVKIPDILKVGMNKEEMSLIVLAFVSTFLSAILTIRFFLKFAKNNSLVGMAIYRFGLAFLLSVYFSGFFNLFFV